MRDVYSALGDVVAAAFANGDELLEGIRPQDSPINGRGVKVEREGYVIRIYADPNEPRFRIDLPFIFTQTLKNSYTAEEVEDRTAIDLETASEQERMEAVEAIVEADLERIDEKVESFRTGLQELQPLDSRLSMIHDTDTELWNGVVLYGFFSPYNSEFTRREYDTAVRRVTQDGKRMQQLLADQLDTILEPDDREQLAADPDSDPSYRGFQ